MQKLISAGNFSCEDELNELLQYWIKNKKRENKNISNNENSNISNPYQTRTKGTLKKRIKSAVEDVTAKYVNRKGKEKQV